MKLPLMSAVIATALLATPVFAQTKPAATPAPVAAPAAPAATPDATPAPATDSTMAPKKKTSHSHKSHKKAAKKTEATPAAADAPK